MSESRNNPDAPVQGERTAKRIGVLGGTFDPIHLGHLHLARRSLDFFLLDQVHFLVSRRPPHKSPGSITSAYHRFALTAAALEPFPCFHASTAELELEGNASNYTWDTLQAICRENHLPPEGLFFIAGGDSFLTVNSWKNYEPLLRTYNFAFFERPEAEIGQDFSHLSAAIRRRIVDVRSAPGEVPSFSPAVFLLDTGAPSISSSEIRKRVSQGEDILPLVPEKVHDYIRKYRLYV